MDAYSGYNQILMLAGDKDHTSFITNRGLYCYRMMPFGLKNAGAMYQKLVNRMFAGQIGNNMEVYVDDMLVKSVYTKDHIRNLKGMFEVLHKYRIKLNPLKYTFRVASEKFLGYMVKQRGIEANSEKIQALIEMQFSSSPKEAQSLTERLVAMNRFISKATNRCQPFFQTIKGGKRFEWMEELSSVLIREEGPIHLPVYCVSKAFQDAETSFDGHNLNCTLRLEFKASNNAVEYEALLAGLRLEQEMKARKLQIHSDSQLVVSQILRVKNGYAGTLSKLVSSRDSDLMKAIPVEKLSRSSIDESLPTTTMTISESSRWMKEIIAYLNDQVLLSDKQEAQKLCRRAVKFVLQDNILYKRGFSHPLLRCLTQGK
ncbi:Ribonuclease H [Abeliophyllum distichum]|uniref:Ribonuclease H n=1 Tax=Abeliophyllum distichum TaxID=126358 RepID=A0ABD1V436_9LAMI